MNDFVYVTYIKTTPQKVWDAITTPEFTRQYWGKAHRLGLEARFQMGHGQPSTSRAPST